jgi:heme-degrading monooxygenase HmoA
MRYAREISFEIKNGKEKEFAGVFESDVVPMLRKQPGFQQELTFVNPKGAHAITLWDDKKSAETYETETYPKVLARLTTLIVGTPTVENFETTNSYART